MIQNTLALGAPSGTKPENILAELKASAAGCNEDIWLICHGKDLVSILIIGFKKLWGKSNLQDDDIFARLRLAYEDRFLWETTFGQTLRAKLESLQKSLASKSVD